MAGNKVAIGHGFKATIRKQLGNDATSPEAHEVVRQATALFGPIVRSLPSDGASVRALSAVQCRHAALATFYANAAVAAGLTTPEGMALAEAARQHDVTAMRASVTAYDRAVKEANAPRNAPTPTLPGWFANDDNDTKGQ